MTYSGRTSFYGIPIPLTGDTLEEADNVLQMQMIGNFLQSGNGIVTTGVIDEGTYVATADTGSGHKVLLQPQSGIAIRALLNGGFASSGAETAWTGLFNGNFYFLYLNFTITLYTDPTAFNIISTTVPISINNESYLFLATCDITSGTPIIDSNPFGKIYAQGFTDHMATQMDPHSPTWTQTNLTIAGDLNVNLLSNQSMNIAQENSGSTSPIFILDHISKINSSSSSSSLIWVPLMSSVDEFIIEDLRANIQLSEFGELPFDNSRNSIVGAINQNAEDQTSNDQNVGINATNIGTNTTNIGNNTTNIGTNTGSINTNITNIGINDTDIFNNATDIFNNASSIANNIIDIDQNALAIPINTGVIINNTANIIVNTASVASVSGQVIINSPIVSLHTSQLFNLDLRVGDLDCAVFGLCDSSSSSSSLPLSSSSSSSVPGLPAFLVSGASIASANGLYCLAGTLNNKDYYEKQGGGWWIYWHPDFSGYWVINDFLNVSVSISAYYDSTGSDGPQPPLNSWSPNFAGPPAPTLSVSECAPVGPSPEQGFTFYLYNQNNNNLYDFDITTGTGTLIGNTGISFITSLTMDPRTGILYAATGNESNVPASLFTVNTTTGSTSLIANTGLRSIMSIAFDMYDNLYAVGRTVSSSTRILHSVNKNTGALTSIGNLSVTSNGNGMGWHSGKLYINISDDLYEIDPIDASLTFLFDHNISAIKDLTDHVDNLYAVRGTDDIYKYNIPGNSISVAVNNFNLPDDTNPDAFAIASEWKTTKDPGFEVTGAGNIDANGFYCLVGTWNGKDLYEKEEGGWWIFWDPDYGGFWYINHHLFHDDGFTVYFDGNQTQESFPPLTGWADNSSIYPPSIPPAPTLNFNYCEKIIEITPPSSSSSSELEGSSSSS